MDVNRLSQGEKIVGISAIVLLLDMFIFKWFGLKIGGGAAFGVSAEGSKNAWGSMDLIRFILLLAVIAGLAHVYIKASDTRVDLPVALSVVVTALAGLGTLLVLFRIISPPDFGVSADGIDHTRKIGAFIGLIAVGALTYGGYRTMEEEGTSFGDAADSFSGGGSGGTGAGPGAGSPPPPPPPPSQGSGSPPPPPPPPPPSSGSGGGGAPPA